MKVLGFDRLGELDRIARTVDVGALLGFGIRLEVVDGRKVEKMGNLLAEFLGVGLVDSQQCLRQIADNRNGPAFLDTPILTQLGDIVGLYRAYEKIDDAALALKQLLDHAFSDEAAGPGDKVVHVVS